MKPANLVLTHDKRRTLSGFCDDSNFGKRGAFHLDDVIAKESEKWRRF